jgi:hypothetical protein
MTHPVLVMTTVDTEEEWDWSAAYPLDGASVSNIDQLGRFQALCERYAMAPTYFTNFAVINDPRARAAMQQIALRPGVEIGMHIHPWHTPPVDASRPVVQRDTFLHNHSSDAVLAKLTTAYRGLVDAGLPPTSFRGGRYSSGGDIHRFLQANGFVADCSVVPFTTWPDDGAPDFRGRGLAPVRIAPAGDGQTPLWELPLSMGFSRTPFELWARAFETIERGPLRSLHLIGIAERLRLVRRVWLNFEIDDPYDWTPFMLLLQRLGVPCITLTVHSSSLVAGPGPYTRTAADEQRIYGKIETVFDAIRRLPGFVPATASRVAHFLENEHAGIGN